MSWVSTTKFVLHLTVLLRSVPRKKRKKKIKVNFTVINSCRLAQVKRRKFVPRPKSTPFFSSQTVISCTRLLWALTTIVLLVHLFWMIFRQWGLFWKIGPPYETKINSAKENKNRKPLGGQAWGWKHRTRAQNFRVCLLKAAWTFGLLCRKGWSLRRSCNYLVSVWDQFWTMKMTWY